MKRKRNRQNRISVIQLFYSVVLVKNEIIDKNAQDVLDDLGIGMCGAVAGIVPYSDGEEEG